VCGDNNSDKGHNDALLACHRGNAGMNSAGFDTAKREGVKCQGFINDLKKERVSLFTALQTVFYLSILKKGLAKPYFSTKYIQSRIIMFCLEL
jgi:hypothetical protein